MARPLRGTRLSIGDRATVHGVNGRRRRRSKPRTTPRPSVSKPRLRGCAHRVDGKTSHHRASFGEGDFTSIAVPALVATRLRRGVRCDSVWADGYEVAVAMPTRRQTSAYSRPAPTRRPESVNSKRSRSRCWTPSGSEITDRCFVVPLPVGALVDRRLAHDAVARALVAKSAREALCEQGFRRPFSLSAWRARASLARSTTAPRLRAARSRRRWVGRGPRAFLRGP